MTKKQIKENISGLSKAQLVDLILDLSSVKGVKDRLDNRFMTEEQRKQRDNELFDKAYDDIFHAFHPARLHIAKGCVSKSTKAINEFKAICDDKDMLAELLVHQIEMISKCFGLLEGELYYNSMVNTTERNVKFLVRNGYVREFLPRLKTALKEIDGDYDLV